MLKQLFFRFSLLIIGIILLQSCSEDHPNLNGKVLGTVYDELTGNLLSNCEVTVSPSNQSMTSESDGSFLFQNLSIGNYTLRFKKAGYEEKAVTQTVIYGLYKRLEVSLKGVEAFAISEEQLDFGDFQKEKGFYLVNNSSENCEYKIGNVPSWANVSQRLGVISPNSSASITVRVDRDAVPNGTYEELLSIVLSGQEMKSFSLPLFMQKVKKAAPLVTVAQAPTKVGLHSITISGNLISTGGSPVSSHGHCWSTGENPTIQGTCSDLGAREAVGEFVSVLKDLESNTTYYIRSYAVNSQGVAYSDPVKVTTDDEMSDKWDGSKADGFSGGTGVVGDPYLVTTGAQLNLIRAPRYCTAQFRLKNNINLDHRAWLPIENFSGELDGGDFTISNLSVDENYYGMGLFAEVTGTIKNLHLKDVEIVSQDRVNVGALAGSIWSEAVISHCTVTLTENSKIQGKENVGGLIGLQNYPSTIQNCQVIGTASIPQIVGYKAVGGLVGKDENGEDEWVGVSNCHVNCVVSGDSYIGGVVGALWNMYTGFSIENCSFTGSLSCKKDGGGIIGAANSGQNLIYGCKVDATLQGKNIGGMISLCENADCSVNVCGCYFKGLMQGAGHSGLLVAYYPSTFDTSWPRCYGSYTLPSEGSTFEYVLSDGENEDCATTAIHRGETPLGYHCVDGCKDIVGHLKKAESQNRVCWDLNNVWVHEALIDGRKVKVNCPKLLWE